MIIIGDVHGKIEQYHEIVKKAEKKGATSVQLGDFGFKQAHDWFLQNIDCERHKVLFGNHDYYPYLNEKHSLGNFCTIENVFFVRGAFSIDCMHRIVGRDYWLNEEMSYKEAEVCLDRYKKVKPEVVVSHTCPLSIIDKIGFRPIKTITNQLLQAMFDFWQPEFWIFGHFHESHELVVNSTHFYCLAELESMEI